MIRNYLKIAYRTLKRRKGYAFINVFGLAVGLAACILIGLYVQDELSYDDFHENADRTYRVLREFDIPDLQTTIAGTPPALAPALEASVPAVEATVRVLRRGGVVQHETRRFAESGFVWADAGFFEVFSFPMLRGEAALDRPGTVVLTEAMATKYFPDENPVGQTLRVGERSLEVTGVMANVPSNSHLDYIDFVGSLETWDIQPSWGYNNFTTYVMLAEGASISEVAPQIDAVITANTQPDGEEAADVIGDGDGFIPHLQPITGIHLGQGVSVEIGAAGNMLYVYLFAALAVFILLLACINFMNLSTARSMERASEVGMRKALGARREQLAGQFLGESILMTLGALLLALVLARLALPGLNALAGKSLSMGALWGGPQVLALVALVVVVGLVAGSYPALALSRFEPATVLRGTLGSAGGRRLRKVLVVFQFAISIAILVGTGVVYQQLDFMRSAGLGFDEDNLVVVENIGFLEGQAETFEQELRQLPGVQGVASGYSMPGTFFINSMWRPAEPGAERQNMNYSFVGWDYVETLGIEMVAGRDLSRAFATDSFAVMLNEAALHDFGWTAEEAVGKEIERGFGDGGPYDFTVVGVMKDFHYRPLHQEIYPLALFAPVQRQNRVAVRVAPGDPRLRGDRLAGTLAAIRGTWEQLSELPFRYSFLADELAAQYRAEERLASVFGLFAGLAILIACLGLFGLAAFTAERRTKEIGIRKVLGASVPSIVMLLSKDFLKLVLVAFVIAAPLAYWAMSTWLEDFAYRIDLGVGVFLLAGFLALVIALATVSYQAIRAALADPVEALRSE